MLFAHIFLIFGGLPPNEKNLFSGIALVIIGLLMVYLNRDKIKTIDPQFSTGRRLLAMGIVLMICGVILVVKYGFSLS